jgi:hypothetical protein
VRLDNLGALDQFPAEERNECYAMVSILFDSKTPQGWRLTEDEHGVVDEEVLHTPWSERDVSVEEDDEDHPPKSNVSLVDLLVKFEAQDADLHLRCMAGNSLCMQMYFCPHLEPCRRARRKCRWSS